MASLEIPALLAALPSPLPWPLPWPQLTAAFLLSLLGGVHCAAMCGGFVGALHAGVSLPSPSSSRATPQRSAWRLVGGYHAGRLTSYVFAGGLAGLIGGGLFAARVLPLQIALLVAGSLMLFTIAASMFGRGAWLKRLEPAGLVVWKRIAPIARRLYPPRSLPQAVAAGLAWGWIPCGMVYAALPLALTAGDAAGGMAVMLFFGLGTLPNLLGLELAIARTRRALAGSSARPSARGRRGAGWLAALRPAAGAALLVFGLSGLAHAAKLAGAGHPAIVAIASLCHR